MTKSHLETSASSLPLLAAFVAGLCIAGVVAATFYAFEPAKGLEPVRESNIPSASSPYQFIDPLLGFSGAQADSPEYADIQRAVTGYIKSQTAATSVSVHFRDLGESAGFTVNPDEIYNPASLNKVPLMIAYYKLDHERPGTLSETLTYAGSNGNDVETFPSPVQLVPGQTYTVEELINRMIRYSDNNALNLLFTHLEESGNYAALTTTTFGDLGVDFGSVSNPVDYIKVRSYSVFFRILYNATYLDRDYSEKALKLLSRTDFTSGIEAGVPNGTSVAHKFGEARGKNGAGNNVQELHDCGIVYYTDHAYLLCVMTKGAEIRKLGDVISSISRAVFSGMEKKYPPKN